MPHQPAPPAPEIMPADVPDTFFTSLPGAPNLPTASDNPGRPRHANELKAMVLYDLIIDDILTHQGCTISDTAARLGKRPSTISLVVRSDFFKARWLQRRAKYNEDLNFRLQSKMAAVAEKALDKTLEVLQTKVNIPLPDLTDLNAGLLDRLGYGPSRSGGGTHVTVNAQAVAAPVSPQVSAEGLARAREHLKSLEAANAASGHKPGNGAALSRDGVGPGPVVEGEAVRLGERGEGDDSSSA